MTRSDHIPAWSRTWWLFKLRAGAISFGISLALITVLTVVLLQWLYPTWFLFQYDGGWQGLRIVIAVDLVLGPLLALVFFDINKPRHLTLFDVAFVGAIQLTAFVWGCYALWSQHPLALIYRDGSFNSLTRDLLDLQESSPQVLNPFINQSQSKPLLIYSKPPSQESDMIAETVEMFTKGIPPFARVSNYQIFGETHALSFQHQEAIKIALSKEHPDALQKISLAHNIPVMDLHLAPATLRSRQAIFVFDNHANLLDAIIVSDDFPEKLGSMTAKQ